MTAQLRFYTTEQVSPRRAWTPEGYLLCIQNPIARVGTLLYGRGEIPVAPNAEGIIRILREPEEVFHPNAILSFAGKPITNEHPPEKVVPANWKEFSIGVVLNPHQGDGRTEDPSLLYADLLIQDEYAIKDILAGKRELSAGYDAEYEQTKPGEGKQHNIIGNHVAFVEKGRCGPVCAIGDSAMPKHKITPAARRTMQSFKDRVMTAFHTGDEEALVDELEKVPDMLGTVATGESVNVGDDMGGSHIHIHTGMAKDEPAVVDPSPAAPSAPAPAQPGAEGAVTLEALAQRIDQLEQAVAILAQGDEPEADPEADPNAQETAPGNANNDRRTVDSRRRTTKDSAASVGGAVMAEAVSRAELLVPGMRAPTFDGKMGQAQVVERIGAFRKNVLLAALKEDGDAADCIKAVTGKNANISAMTTDAAHMVFNAASEMMRNSGMRSSNHQPAPNPAAGLTYGNGPVLNLQDTVANINKVNRERYGVTGR